MSKKALVTGITGQDGSYLAEFLLSMGYEVHGIIRRASTFNTHRLEHIYLDNHDPKSRLFLHYGDLADPGLITDIIYNVRPDEVYHLGAQSHVRVSFDMPEYTGNVTGLGTTRVLEAIRRSGTKARFYQASSSEMFGIAPPPQSEVTPFRPRSPYAASKVYSYWLTVNYREGYNLFACNGILFNHESPRRGETFVTRKITRAISHMLAGRQQKIYLGNLDALRDWGYAPEYVEAMWLMLQQETPGDFVIGTGESHSVREFLTGAFEYAGVEIEWSGVNSSGLEKGYARSFNADWSTVLNTGDIIVETDPRYFRPTEVSYLQADITKARGILGWAPKFSFGELIKVMVDSDFGMAGLTPPGEGAALMDAKGLNWTRNQMTLHGMIAGEIG